MEKLLKEIIEGQNQILNRLGKVEQNMATKDDLREIEQSQARMENDMGEKISALFDAREVQNDMNERIIGKLDAMDSKINTVSNRLEKVEQNMATKEDIDKLTDMTQQDVVAMLGILNTKFDHHGAKLDVISIHLIDNEADIQLLKRAK